MRKYIIVANNKIHKEINYASNSLKDCVNFLQDNTGIFISFKIYEVKEAREMALDEVNSRLKVFK